jgi:hypothetical protein
MKYKVQVISTYIAFLEVEADSREDAENIVLMDEDIHDNFSHVNEVIIEEV